MASHSLLDLVCQLQNFETKISEIVMEMATKLCALNDTKLFILLSTFMGRKVDPPYRFPSLQFSFHDDDTSNYMKMTKMMIMVIDAIIMAIRELKELIFSWQ